MNRRDFQRLAELRISEAETLLGAGQFAGAFYLAGYAVECALKACIAKQTNRYDFPPSPEEVRGIYTHDLKQLVKAARIQAPTKAERGLDTSWSILVDPTNGWSEIARYRSDITEANARGLYTAIVDDENGVLPWLKRFW